MNRVSIIAAGDVFMTRRLPGTAYPGERELARLLAGYDVRFANLEVTVHDREGYPGAVSGGTWAMAHPRILDDLSRYGFNICNAANNHAMDYSHNGLLATMKYLRAADMPFAGIGANLADASAPVYIETPNGRVALIACVSSCPDFWRAGQQRMDMQGRPGVNALRFRTRYHITREHMKALRAMAAPLAINAQHDSMVREGFAAEDKGFYRFGTLEFEEDTREFQATSPNPTDMARITASIQEARRQADIVLVSIHAHETPGDNKELPAEFLQTFAHTCIDAGAHAILGHGPHILRGMELYHGGAIFYSLGNFLFENDTTTHQPADFYPKYGLPENAFVGEGMDARSKQNTIGLGVDPRVWMSVLPGLIFQDGELVSITLHPIEMGCELPRYRKGLPALTDSTAAPESFARLSKPFGTKIIAEDGAWKVVIP